MIELVRGLPLLHISGAECPKCGNYSVFTDDIRKPFWRYLGRVKKCHMLGCDYCDLFASTEKKLERLITIYKPSYIVK